MTSKKKNFWETIPMAYRPSFKEIMECDLDTLSKNGTSPLSYLVDVLDCLKLTGDHFLAFYLTSKTPSKYLLDRVRDQPRIWQHDYLMELLIADNLSEDLKTKYFIKQWKNGNL